MTVPIAIGMVAQIAYQLIDLYFVSRLGVAATAGVNAAANVTFIVVAISQVLSVGSTALISHAVGRKDQTDANLLFNQSISLSLVCSTVVIAFVYLLIRPYLRLVAADPQTVEAGFTFVIWLLPGCALMLPMAVMTSSLRGLGLVKPAVSLYMLTIVVNAILAPVLIAGWGTRVPLGVMGAGLATTASVAVGVVVGGGCFHCFQRYITIDRRLMIPKFRQWRRILLVGLPVGADLVLYSCFITIVYYAIREFGSAAQAGFGVGSQVLQAILLPAVSIALAVGPIAGQNLGANNLDRVAQTFRNAVTFGIVAMVASAIVVQSRPMALLGMFGADSRAIGIAAAFLQLTSWSLVAQTLISTCTSMFQALGNTMPSLISTSIRVGVFSITVLWISRRATFHIEEVWYVWVASLALQAIVSLCLLRIEFKRQVQTIR